MTLTQAKAVVSSTAFQVTAATVLSGVISGVASHVLTKKLLEQRYADLAVDEIEQAKRFYSALNKKGDFSSPEKALTALDLVRTDPVIDELESNDELIVDAVTVIKTYQGVPEDTERSVFDTKCRDLAEDEITNRDTSKPYVITDEEFTDSSSNYQQITLTYYDDDGVLADERDLPVDDIRGTVGEDNLTRFGEGSNDSRIVYIRNEHMDVDFEVVLHSGNYAEIVHGITNEPVSRKRKSYRGDDA